MKRFQLFEFGDQPWLSGWVREGYLDCLSFVHRVYQPYYHFTETIVEWAKSEHADKILDIGSGSAEHISTLLKACDELGLDAPQFVVSDLYPDLTAYANLQKEFGASAIAYLDQPLSALDIQGTNIRNWTFFTAFHHFPPAAASQLLEQLALKGDGLCILELTQRNLFSLIMMLLGFPANLLAPFFAREFQFRKFLFTTIIPIIPLMVAFDGAVSVLRSYTNDEIVKLMPPESRDQFHFEYQEAKFRHMPSCKVSMVLITRNAVPTGTAQRLEVLSRR